MMTHMKRFHLCLVLLLALTAAIVFWTIRNAGRSLPLSLRTLGRTNNPSGVPATIFQVTNSSSTSFSLDYQTSMQTNQMWVAPASQIELFCFRQTLPARSHCTFAFPAPAEGGPWRVRVFGKPMNRFKSHVSDFVSGALGVPLELNKTIQLQSEIQER